MRNLFFLLSLVAVSGSIQSQTIDEWYLAYSGPSSHTIAQLPAGAYTLKVSGIFCGGSCWGENGADAAYFLPSQNPSSGRSFTINEYCPQGWEGSGDCAFLRPTPDVYSPAHEYDYLIDHTGGDFTVFGLADDCCWSDNTGGLTFELQPASPFSECFDFEWLITDTIIGIAEAELSIEVNPFDNSGLAQEIWHNTYPASGANGGFSQSVIHGDSVFIAGATWPGNTTDQLMTCITRDGSLVWQQVRAPGGDHDGFLTLCQDGNRLLFGGSQNAQGTNYFDATWVATDLSGSELDFNFSPEGGTSGAKDFLQLPNGTILLSHYQWPNGSVMRLDENDEVSAQSPWHSLGTYGSPLLTLSDEPDAFFFVGAASNSHVTIRRYADDLTEQMNWDLDLDFPVFIHDATWQDGHLFIAGRTTDSNASGLLLKVNESGISEMHIDTSQSSFYAIQASAGEVWTTKSYGTAAAYTHSSFGKAFAESGYEELTVLNGGMPFVPYSISGDELDFFISGTEGPTYWQSSAPAASRVTVETTNLDSLTIEWSNGETGQSITTTLSSSQWLSVDVTLGDCQWQDSVYINIEVPGCTDSSACNFDLLANSDDGSCEYGCLYCGEGTVWDSTLAQCISIADTVFIEPEACAPSCGEGTVWDPVNEECIIAIPADLNYDGCVSVNDLLVLLAVHGTCPPYPEWPDEPTDTTWTCGDPVTYWDYDYATVLIGDQCWFAENLRTTLYANGDSIPSGLTDGEWASTTTGATAVFGEGSSNCINWVPEILDACNDLISLEAYGRLYNWYAVDDIRNLCAAGWHVASDDEWTVLENFVGEQGFSGIEGEVLKSTYGWYNNGNGSNEFGFKVFPAGNRNFNDAGTFRDAGWGGYFWRSTSIGDDALGCSLGNNYGHIHHQAYSKRNGFSVRCVKD